MIPLADAAEPFEREVAGVELLVAEPGWKRLLGLERRPEVRWPAPVEGAIGHLLLRLVDDGPPSEQWVVAVSAYMDLDGDGVDDPSSVWRGVFGGYDLKLVLAPLPEVASTYAAEQARWLRRFPLPMSEAEVAVLEREVRAAAAASEARALGPYRFFTENCSTELTALLDVALLGRDRELNYPATVPNKLRRRGRTAPAVATVEPDATATRAFDEVWASPPELARRCPAGDEACARRFVAAATETFGAAWVDALAGWTRRRAYRETWSPELRRAIAEAGRPPGRS